MKKYVFKPYEDIFPQLFDQEKDRILSLVKRDVFIEHVGSTAVRGLGGKGIIDIAIAAYKKDRAFIAQILQNLGYEFRQNGSTPERLFFIIDLPDPLEGSRRYHVHLTYPDSKDWKDLLLFRDYLKTHPEKAQEYEEIKKRAVIEAGGEGLKQFP